MTEIKAADVKSLRDKTGLGIMECKAALKETGGNLDEAVEYLKINSNLKAEKKASRTAVEGLLLTANNLMVEVNCETDFVAKDENFKTFSQFLENFHFAPFGKFVMGFIRLLFQKSDFTCVHDPVTVETLFFFKVRRN